MGKKVLWILGIILILIIFIILSLYFTGGLRQLWLQVGPGKMCLWVFKTSGNYSDLIAVKLTQSGSFQSEPALYNIRMVEGGYFLSGGSCSSEKPNIAFTSITKTEWNESQEDCFAQMEQKRDQIRIQKCGSLNFDVFQECVYGEISCEKMIVPDKPNPTTCQYNITKEERLSENSCEPKLTSKDLMEHIIDENPFTEFYVCKNISYSQINQTILSGQLSQSCGRIV